MSSGPLRKGRLPVVLALVALILLIPAIVYVAGRTTGSFNVDRIFVTGQRPLHTRDLRRALESGYLGDNLFSVSAGDVSATLHEFPYVATVAVDRDFPHTLRVRLTEFTAAALLHAAGHWDVVSAEGRVFADAESPKPSPSATVTPKPQGSASPTPATTGPAPSPSPSTGEAAVPPPDIPAALRRLPVIESDVPVALGDDIADQRVKDALALLAALPRRLRASALAVRTSDSTALVVFGKGLLVEFGNAADLARKVTALQLVLARYRSRHVAPTLVDVSVPNLPLARPLLSVPATP